MNDLTMTTHQTIVNGSPVIDKVIVHTATSCHLIDNVLCTITGEKAIDIAKIIIGMHKAIDRAEMFISGFEDDETQTGVDDILSMLRQFNLQSTNSITL